MASQTEIAYYLYAFIEGAEEKNFGALGIQGGEVYTISNDMVSAVVSEVPNQRLRPERRNLSAHNHVLNELMKSGTPLPVTFGILADNPEDVQGILTNSKETLNDHLERVRDRMEMVLKVSWNVPNIFEFFVEQHTELREERDRIYLLNREPTQDEKISLGQFFNQLLEADREHYTTIVEEGLQECFIEVRRNKCRDEQRVMDLAFLVDRDQEKEFENGIYRVANEFEDCYNFDYNGPFVPHSFVELQLSL